jgi:hypothetical protein
LPFGHLSLGFPSLLLFMLDGERRLVKLKMSRSKMLGSYVPLFSSLAGCETRCLLEPNPDQRGSGGGGGKYFGEEVEQKGTAGTGAGAGAGAGVGCVVCGIAPMRAGKDTPVAH